MNKSSLTIENNNEIQIDLSTKLKCIPKNNLNWYILELSASGDIKKTVLKISMLDLLKKNQVV